ncbi:hypothetical protein C8J56DRAFT_196517 [Mycena floridula]|nr:hypothetical protein C8J56DRAFT_196517 [Mycena floridula]
MDRALTVEPMKSFVEYNFRVGSQSTPLSISTLLLFTVKHFIPHVTAPAESVRIDDSDLSVQYSAGDWGSGVAEKFNSTTHNTTTVNATAMLHFTGTRIEVYGTIQHYSPKEPAPISNYSVDDGEPTTFAPKLVNTSVTVYQQQFFASSTLRDGNHTLTVISMTNGPLYLDYFIVGTVSHGGNLNHSSTPALNRATTTTSDVMSTGSTSTSSQSSSSSSMSTNVTGISKFPSETTARSFRAAWAKSTKMTTQAGIQNGSAITGVVMISVGIFALLCCFAFCCYSRQKKKCVIKRAAESVETLPVSTTTAATSSARVIPPSNPRAAITPFISLPSRGNRFAQKVERVRRDRGYPPAYRSDTGIQ